MNYLEAKYMFWVVLIILVMESPNVVSRKKSKNQDDATHQSQKDRSKGEDTCVSGYCLDPTYNKLELPSSKPSHVRINLEVMKIL